MTTGRPLGSADVVLLARITYRQLDYWCRQGWLFPVDGVGSGTQRVFPARELAIACRMAAYLDIGIVPPDAATYARDGVPW